MTEEQYKILKQKIHMLACANYKLAVALMNHHNKAGINKINGA